MNYYICQLMGSGIVSSQSSIYDNNGNQVFLNPYNSYSQIWGRTDYELLDCIEETIDNINIIWEVDYNGKSLTYRHLCKYINMSKEEKILFGIEPSGYIAVWKSTERKQKLVFWGASMMNSDSQKIRISERYLQLMKQFTYRYVVHFSSWNSEDNKWDIHKQNDALPILSYIEEELFDGTYDKLHDEGLMRYHDAGKPMKLKLKWVIAKSAYKAFIWFDEDVIGVLFNRFYGAHAYTKTDFCICIDPQKKRYELSLYRYGLTEPFVISEDSYQMLVFKNGFENYRSPNYAQIDGAWIW